MAAKSLVRDIDHKQRLHNKYERLQGLRALLEEWVAQGYNETDMYVCKLQRRIRLTEVQLKNMRP
jgi:hypothetical protein